MGVNWWVWFAGCIYSVVQMMLACLNDVDSQTRSKMEEELKKKLGEKRFQELQTKKKGKQTRFQESKDEEKEREDEVRTKPKRGQRIIVVVVVVVVVGTLPHSGT